MDTNWKLTPLEDLLDTPIVKYLNRAGFKTAGDVLDADAEVIAARTYMVGQTRAEKLRSDVLRGILESERETRRFEGGYVIVDQPPEQYIPAWVWALIVALFAGLIGLLINTIWNVI